MKIAVLYVGIGVYIKLWKDFYMTCEEHFLPGVDKHYFLFTDKNDMKQEYNVTLVHQDDLGWPCNVVFRYQFQLRVKKQISNYDFAFFFNGNTRFCKTVKTDDFLPTEDEGWLIGLTWKDENDPPASHPYERRKESVVYIPYETNGRYYQSGITGGKTDVYIALLEECDELTKKDFKNGIVPVWHDESVYNKYMLNRRCKLITKDFANASQRDKAHKCKIVFQKKEDVLGRKFLRNYKKRPHTQTWLVKFYNRLFG